MPSISRLQDKRDELQKQYDLLSEKIQSLRAAYAIEAGTAVRFQLEKQIGQAESERDTIEQQIEALESEVERQIPEEGGLPDYSGWHVPVWVIYTLQVVGAIITLLELLGMIFKGLRFLGEFATNPGAVLIAIVAFNALLWFTCGHVLLKRQKGTDLWRRRPPTYAARDRVIARIILVASVVTNLILILGVLRYDIVHAQPVVEGQLGVAIAQFGEGIDMRASARGRELSAFVARNLRREIDLPPGLADDVTIISGPLVRSEEEAQRVAGENNVALVIWGWVSGDDTFVPTFTFVEPSDTEVGLKEVPGWYEVEISGGGTLELSQTVARRTSGLIEYIVGLIYLNQGDYDKAAAEFQRAIDMTKEAQDKSTTDHEARTMNRTLAIYHLALGRTFAAQGNPDQARAEYETAKGCDSAYGPIYIGFGNIDYSERRFEEALNWYEKAVELVPEIKKVSAFYSRGNAHFFLGQYEAAAADYALAIEKADPDDKSLGLYHLVLGITLCRLNRFSEGLEEIAQAQQLAEPGTSLRQAALTELENCGARARVTAPTPIPTLFPTSTPAPTLTPTNTPRPRAPTPSPTSFIGTLTPTSFPTPVPPAPPEPMAPAMGHEYQNPIIFQWHGSLRTGQAYQVTARHTESGYEVQSGLLTDQSWSTGLPEERYAEWRWTVSVVQDGRVVTISSEWMFWFKPFPGGEQPTLFPTLTPESTLFPTGTPLPPATPTPMPTLFPTGTPPPTATPTPP